MENMTETALQVQSGEKDSISRQQIILLAGTLFLGILFNILFYQNEPGLSIPAFVAAFYGILFLNTGGGLKFKPDLPWALSIPVLLLSLTYLFYSNMVFFALNLMAIPILIVAQTVLITGNSSCLWHYPGFLADLLYGFFCRTFINIAGPIKILSSLSRRKAGKAGGSAAGKVLLGIAIAFPILLVVISLLISADRIFENFMGRIPDLFRDLNLGEIIGRGFIILFIFFTSFSFILSLMEKKKPGFPAEWDGRVNLPKIWDHVTVITVMILVNVIYVVFVLIQFAYLFGGVRLDLPADFTYSEYARRGFFELIAVTVINFSILMLCIGFTKMTGVPAKFLRFLYSLLVGNTLVMLVSAYYRMLLYEEAYGFTYLRVLTQAFMIFMLVLFGITLLRVWNDGITLVKPFIIAAVAAYLIVNYVNIDVIIAQNNINRYYATNKIDVGYLSTLSYDAVPEIAKLAVTRDEKLADEIAGLLKDKKEEALKNKSWQSFNISRFRAANISPQ